MAEFRKFDVKRGITVNGLPFVDENRNVTLNNLTVQGTSTIIDTRTITSVDPIISLGVSGTEYTATSVATGNPGRIFFDAEAFADIVVGDSIEYTAGTAAITTAGGALTNGGVYYVKSKESDVTSGNYRSITISDTQGGSELDFTDAGTGNQTFTLNPLQDLDQDLGIEFNYVDTTAKKGFFGYQDNSKYFTFLLETSSYSGSDSVSDTGSPIYTGKRGSAHFKSIKLEPSDALTTSLPSIDVVQTWSNATTNFTAISANISITNSGVDAAADSKLIYLAVNSSEVLSLKYTGETKITSSLTQTGDNALELASTWDNAAGVFTGIKLDVTGTNYAAGSKLLDLNNTNDELFTVDSEGRVVSRVKFATNTVQTGLSVNVTPGVVNTDYLAGSLLLDLQVDNVSKFNVDLDGNLTATGLTSTSLVVNGTANIEESLTIQTKVNDTGSAVDTIQLQTNAVTIANADTDAQVLDSFDKGTFSSAEFLIQVKQGTDIHTTKLIVVENQGTIYLTEYGTVYNNDIIVTFDAVLTGNNVEIKATKTAASQSSGDITIKSSRMAITT